MNRKQFIKTTLEYFRTFAITIFVAFLLAIGLLKYIQYSAFENIVTQKSQIIEVDYSSINIMIEKYKYLENKYPENYKISLKLGELYELKEDYKNAEIEYQKAISKVPYDEYKPQYKLALLYIQLNLLDKAQSIMDEIDEQPHKRLVKYKADVYTQLGDKYYNQGDYANAVEHYEKALSYWKVIKNKEGIEYTKNSLASSYVYLADVQLDNMEPDDAIESLKTALSIINAPILKYKLALLLTGTEPETSYNYIVEVFKKAPEIINYEESFNFINTLADNADTEGNIALANLYRYKAKEIKDYFKTNILSVDDIRIEDVYGNMIFKNFRKRYKINFEFRLKNTSPSNISSLYLTVTFKDGDKIIDEYAQQIANNKSILGVGFYSPLISINTYKKQTYDDVFPKQITAEIYVSKTAKSHKILLETYTIKEVIKKRTPSSFEIKMAKFIQSIMSKFPAFLY